MPSSKDIFGPYWNGDKAVYGDPLRIDRCLFSLLGPDPRATIEQANSEDPAISYPATDLVMKSVDEAFGMVPFDSETGTGALDEDRYKVLNQYLLWRGEVKKNTMTSPSSSPSTAPALINCRPKKNTG